MSSRRTFLTRGGLAVVALTVALTSACTAGQVEDAGSRAGKAFDKYDVLVTITLDQQVQITKVETTNAKGENPKKIAVKNDKATVTATDQQKVKLLIVSADQQLAGAEVKLIGKLTPTFGFNVDTTYGDVRAAQTFNPLGANSDGSAKSYSLQLKPPTPQEGRAKDWDRFLNNKNPKYADFGFTLKITG